MYGRNWLFSSEASSQHSKVCDQGQTVKPLCLITSHQLLSCPEAAALAVAAQAMAQLTKAVRLLQNQLAIRNSEMSASGYVEEMKLNTVASEQIQQVDRVYRLFFFTMQEQCHFSNPWMCWDSCAREASDECISGFTCPVLRRLWAYEVKFPACWFNTDYN